MDILVTGYLDRNFGDDMFIRILANELEVHNIYLSTNQKELLLPFKDIKNIYDADNYKNVSFEAIVRIIGSGFAINNKMGMYYSLQRIKNYIYQSKKCKKLIAINCNAGPYLNKFSIFLAKIEMSFFKLITTRDQYSHDFVKTHLKNCETYCFPDIVLSMPDEWLSAKTDTENCLGISAYRSISTPQFNYDYYVAMSKVADEYIERTNNKVLLFAFDLESENDITAAYTIKSLCKNSEKVEIILHIDNGDNIMKNMARCSRLIAVRFHSAILAMRMNIPFLPIIYSNKLDNVLNDICYTGERIRFGNLKNIDVSKTVDLLLQNKVALYSGTSLIKESAGHINKLKYFLHESH